MTITPSDSLDLLIARGPPDATDFAKQIAGLPGAYYAGLDEAYKRRTQDAFQGGVPTKTVTGPDGRPMTVPNWDAAGQTILQAGGTPAVDSYIKLAALQQQQDKIEYGQRAERDVNPPPAGGGATSGGYIPDRQGSNPNTIANVFAANGITDQADVKVGQAIGQVARSLRIDPSTPLDLNNPTHRAAVGDAIRVLKSGASPAPGVQPQQPAVAQAQPAPPQQPGTPPQPVQTTPFNTFGDRFGVGNPASTVPTTMPTTGAGITPAGRTDARQLQILSAKIASGMLEPGQEKNYLAAAAALREKMALTPGLKEYATSVQQDLQAGRPIRSFDQWQTENAGSQAGAKAGAEAFVKRYETITETGSKALQEIPQLQLAQKLMDDPNFFSGAGEKYNLALKRVAVALGADPNTAAPQEAFRKIVSGSILQGLKGLQGIGQIRVAEINLLKQAAASNENTPAANRILLTSAQRLNERNAAIAGMAQNYKGGNIDSGFDRQVAEYDRTHPLFSDGEINNFRNIISGAKGAPTVSNGATATNPKTGERLIFRNGKWEPHA